MHKDVVVAHPANESVKWDGHAVGAFANATRGGRER
jgi:hypothetical protein